eukprot:NODE_57_length_25931_cov_0.351037.p9 type:complete len:419 gc:universal NODE_57_length_25931_cov_0.351037:4487-3231(-)
MKKSPIMWVLMYPKGVIFLLRFQMENDSHPFEIAQKKKKRNRATPEQVAILESFFYTTPCPNSKAREELSTQINMPERSVQIWFQNRRAKMRNMQKQSQGAINVPGGRMSVPKWRRNSTPYGVPGSSPANMPTNMLQQMMYYKNMTHSQDTILHVDTLVVGSQVVKHFHVWFSPLENKIWIQMSTQDSKVIIHIPFPVQMEWMDNLEGLPQSPCSGIRLLTENYQITFEDLTPCEKSVMDEHGVTLLGGPSLQQQFMQMQSVRRPSTISISSGISPIHDRRMSLPYQQLNDLMVTPPLQGHQQQLAVHHMQNSHQPQVSQFQQPHDDITAFLNQNRSRANSAPAHQIQTHLQHMYGREHSMLTPGSSPNTHQVSSHSPLVPAVDALQLPEQLPEYSNGAQYSESGPNDSEPDFLSNLI